MRVPQFPSAISRLPHQGFSGFRPARARRTLRRVGSYSPVDQVLELIDMGRLRQGQICSDLACEDELSQGLVESLHPILLLPGLHGAVYLMDLVLADEISYRGVGSEALHGDASP